MSTNRLLFCLAVAAALFSFVANASGDLEMLAGKWSLKQGNDRGQNY
jgi:hypothetical protein